MVKIFTKKGGKQSLALGSATTKTSWEGGKVIFHPRKRGWEEGEKEQLREMLSKFEEFFQMIGIRGSGITTSNCGKEAMECCFEALIDKLAGNFQSNPKVFQRDVENGIWDTKINQWAVNWWKAQQGNFKK